VGADYFLTTRKSPPSPAEAGLGTLQDEAGGGNRSENSRYQVNLTP